MTYKRAQEVYLERHGKTVKTCWIADIKRKFGTTTHEAWNRQAGEPSNPCPADVRDKLEPILKERGMI